MVFIYRIGYMTKDIIFTFYELIVDEIELLIGHAVYSVSERFKASNAALKALSISPCVFSVLTVGQDTG